MMQPEPLSTNAMMANMPASQAMSGELLRMLAEIGFVSTSCGLWAHADAIFKGVQAVRPKSEFPFMSQAIARMTVGDDARAIDILKNHALKINPRNSMAQSFLGVALKRSGKDKEAKELFDMVLEENQDPKAVAMAKMGQSEDFLKN
jgi:lipoprotein NlpI